METAFSGETTPTLRDPTPAVAKQKVKEKGSVALEKSDNISDFDRGGIGDNCACDVMKRMRVIVEEQMPCRLIEIPVVFDAGSVFRKVFFKAREADFILSPPPLVGQTHNFLCCDDFGFLGNPCKCRGRAHCAEERWACQCLESGSTLAKEKAVEALHAANTAALTSSVANKAAAKELERIDALFQRYADQESLGMIGPEQIEDMCMNLRVEIMDVRDLMFAWKMRAARQGYFPLKEPQAEAFLKQTVKVVIGVKKFSGAAKPLQHWFEWEPYCWGNNMYV